MTDPLSFDFDRDVVQASAEQPILVDFWAPWCGPCQTLGPVLEKLAEEAGPAWRLVKINTEEHGQLAQRAGIRGIPAVKLFADGQLLAEFTGALPEPILRRWLDEHLPSAVRQRVQTARELVSVGRRAEAKTLLEEALAEEPDHEEARTLLARLVALDDTARALALLDGLEHRSESEALRTLDRFRRLTENDLPEASVREDYLAAARALRTGDTDTALDRLVAVVQRDRGYDEDGARKAALALFLVLGEADPVAKKHRRTFNMSLY